ncbi:MAG: hypothetical protein ACP5D2_02075 [Candidatus Nanoarchaeia archaeon]
MKNDKRGYEVCRKLLYFYENKIPIHFKDLDNIFYNGSIEDLNEGKLTMILHERVKGTIPILLECINPDTICKMEVREQ